MVPASSGVVVGGPGGGVTATGREQTQPLGRWRAGVGGVDVEHRPGSAVMASPRSGESLHRRRGGENAWCRHRGARRHGSGHRRREVSLRVESLRPGPAGRGRAGRAWPRSACCRRTSRRTSPVRVEVARGGAEELEARKVGLPRRSVSPRSRTRPCSPMTGCRRHGRLVGGDEVLTWSRTKAMASVMASRSRPSWVAEPPCWVDRRRARPEAGCRPPCGPDRADARRSVSSSWSARTRPSRTPADAPPISAPLEAGVVLHARPRGSPDLAATQPRDTTGTAARQAGLLGGDPGTAGGEELAHLLTVVHP